MQQPTGAYTELQILGVGHTVHAYDCWDKTLLLVLGTPRSRVANFIG